jgi:hypothetical protein
VQAIEAAWSVPKQELAAWFDGRANGLDTRKPELGFPIRGITQEDEP